MKFCALSLISVNFGIIGDVKASLLNQKTFTGYALLALILIEIAGCRHGMAQHAVNMTREHVYGYAHYL